jgi:ABC-type transporter Mla maintaining outer membrane lipid asymmetry permease subunit MlaE
LVEATQNLEGFINVCRFIGRLSVPILWFSGVVGAIVMMWQTFKGK